MMLVHSNAILQGGHCPNTSAPDTAEDSWRGNAMHSQNHLLVSAPGPATCTWLQYQAHCVHGGPAPCFQASSIPLRAPRYERSTAKQAQQLTSTNWSAMRMCSASITHVLRRGHGNKGHCPLIAEVLIGPRPDTADELNSSNSVVGHQHTASSITI